MYSRYSLLFRSLSLSLFLSSLIGQCLSSIRFAFPCPLPSKLSSLSILHSSPFLFLSSIYPQCCVCMYEWKRDTARRKKEGERERESIIDITITAIITITVITTAIIDDHPRRGRERKREKERKRERGDPHDQGSAVKMYHYSHFYRKVNL